MRQRFANEFVGKYVTKIDKNTKKYFIFLTFQTKMFLLNIFCNLAVFIF